MLQYFVSIDLKVLSQTSILTINLMNSTADILKARSCMSCIPPDSFSLLNFKEPESNATSPDGKHTTLKKKNKQWKTHNPWTPKLFWSTSLLVTHADVFQHTLQVADLFLLSAMRWEQVSSGNAYFPPGKTNVGTAVHNPGSCFWSDKSHTEVVRVTACRSECSVNPKIQFWNL